MTPATPSPAAAPAPTGRWQACRQLFLGRPRSRHDHLDALDGLRGLAVMIVLMSHLANAGLGLLPGAGLAGTGKSGVYLFFVLSAFLLCRALLERPPAGFADARLWADYALRRVLRIWPLYLLLLLLSWALTTAAVSGWHYQIDTPALLRHLQLREGQSVLWSIPPEFIFYLWLPLLALALAWLRQRHWPLRYEVAIAVGTILLASLAWPASESALNDIRLGPYLGIFLCGAFAAYCDHRLRAASRPPSAVAWAGVGAVAVVAWVLTIPQVWASVSGDPVVPNLNHRWFVFFGLAWSALLLAVLHGPGWLRAPFAWAPARLVGVVSFSAYLWHMPVLDALRAAGLADWPLASLIVLASVLAVAMLSYLLFERPWRDLRLRPRKER